MAPCAATHVLSTFNWHTFLGNKEVVRGWGGGLRGGGGGLEAKEDIGGDDEDQGLETRSFYSHALWVAVY